MISAKVIADSKFNNHRITTMVITFPRFILAELNTHRLFSRNSASSRAIPFEKMVQSVEENPFIPIAWQKDHKGMQGSEYSTNNNLNPAFWLAARDEAVKYAKALNQESDVTKQLCNRLLEPFMWHTVIVTATEWNNFFELRCPKYYDNNIKNHHFRSWKDLIQYHLNVKKANRNVIEQLENTPIVERLKLNKGESEIHMMALAEAMWDAMNESNPKLLEDGDWHIPYLDTFNLEKIRELAKKQKNPNDITKVAIKVSVAKCARVSYTIFGKDKDNEDYEKDLLLHDRLLESKHMSPFEHCASAMNSYEHETFVKGRLHLNCYGTLDETSPDLWGWCNNFKGFIQYRYYLENGY